MVTHLAIERFGRIFPVKGQVMKTRTYVVFSALIFTIVAAVHLVRLGEGWPIMLGTASIPLWASLIAFLISGLIALWGFILLGRKA